eukprot:tig00020723_g13489.t1
MAPRALQPRQCASSANASSEPVRSTPEPFGTSDCCQSLRKAPAGHSRSCSPGGAPSSSSRTCRSLLSQSRLHLLALVFILALSTVDAFKVTTGTPYTDPDCTTKGPSFIERVSEEQPQGICMTYDNSKTSEKRTCVDGKLMLQTYLSSDCTGIQRSTSETVQCAGSAAFGIYTKTVCSAAARTASPLAGTILLFLAFAALGLVL